MSSLKSEPISAKFWSSPPVNLMVLSSASSTKSGANYWAGSSWILSKVMEPGKISGKVQVEGSGNSTVTTESNTRLSVSKRGAILGSYSQVMPSKFTLKSGLTEF